MERKETPFRNLVDLLLGNTKTKKKLLDANNTSADLYYYDDLYLQPWNYKLKAMITKSFIITVLIYLFIISIQALRLLPVEYRGFLAILEVGLSIFLSYRYSYLGMSLSASTNGIAAIYFFRSAFMLSSEIVSDIEKIPEDMLGLVEFAPPLLVNLAFMRISLVIVSILVAYISSQNNKHIYKLERIAFIDNLTGVYNHRYFHTLVEEKIKHADSTNSSLGMIMIDIDNFRKYNNTYGRNEGDELLAKTAYVLFKETKKQDIVCRYGGDEFAILISDTNTNDVLWIIERIKKSYKEMVRKEKLPEDITLSIGYSIYPNFARNMDDLVMQATSALYQAKNKGRNNVQLYRDVFEEIKAFFNSDEDQLFAGVRVLLGTVSAKDKYTLRHSERVMDYTEKIGRELGLSKSRLRELKIAALLHDIGKVEIPEAILNKSTPLTNSELLLMRNHPIYSVDILEPLSSMELLIDTIKHHHERYDGNGYPSRIKGNKIPFEARILCVADAFDAMLSNRPYRKGMNLEQAVKELKKESGSQFDPDIVDALLSVLNM
ncbi:diguanylate cyclase [Herbivorax sp. ANBcel31]|uniref:bifunctional diguanylate cyclase/phosphohydrolase n=1 Tax=Herbivorax sp. ANBcel31 TaxID=3069754 RepID=UPI0027B50314|nr:diguanylate cyclase [Herbivorax sp. ANBcel31]MDQ2085800.1 diguanylate cyclase [Herbivorax sp. ANBcel31]